ncbi:hypothetical protein SAMN04489760_10215 [Syntrophus gentianae]|uniref:Uncharacterized protein n=1 Tax=Syntrophus gentianae TaxID=43775 RepID=A0A1H7UPB5_9BACT|nr:hypothetical protein [Syntrophus gentianae]SEL98801.1 hypothetical protein SAMN04489760_10215 [Syntrophus gentianae]
MVTVELTDEEAKEAIELLKAAITPLERALAATDIGHRDYRDFIKKRMTLVNELIKRCGG